MTPLCRSYWVIEQRRDPKTDPIAAATRLDWMELMRQRQKRRYRSADTLRDGRRTSAPRERFAGVTGGALKAVNGTTVTGVRLFAKEPPFARTLMRLGRKRRRRVRAQPQAGRIRRQNPPSC